MLGGFMVLIAVGLALFMINSKQPTDDQGDDI
jgi:hypothetical protein